MKAIKKSTKILLVITLFLFVIIIGLILAGKPLDKNVSSGPVYYDTEYGFSFQFPSDWAIEKSASGIDIFGPKAADGQSVSASMIITQIGENPNRLSMSGWLQSKGWAFENLKEITLGEKLRGFTISDLNPGAYNNMVLINFLKDDKVFQIEWYDGEKENREGYQDFLRVISTLEGVPTK